MNGTIATDSGGAIAAASIAARCWAPPQEAPAKWFAALADEGSTIEQLARLVATDRLSPSAKVCVLEQWRYDLVQRQVAVDDGLSGGPGDAALLQQVDRTLRLLDDRKHGRALDEVDA